MQVVVEQISESWESWESKPGTTSLRKTGNATRLKIEKCASFFKNNVRGVNFGQVEEYMCLSPS